MTGAHVIGRWIRDRARATPDRVAIDDDGRLVTYAELDDASDRFAAAFLDRGLSRGDRVATLTGSTPEHVAVFFACAKTGLTLLPLSWRLSPAELRYQLDDAEPSLFLADAEHEELAAATGHGFERLEGPRPGVRPRDVAVADEDGLLLVYTSGTTGKPKGALLTHANCFWTNLGFDLTTGVSQDDVVLQVLPQFHVGGWNVQALLAWWKGATVVLERAVRPGARAAADRGEARDDDDGCPCDVPHSRAGAGLRARRPVEPAPRSRGRRADAGGAARDVGRARHRHRPGLRAHRGGTERAVPAAGGGGAEARLRRQAVLLRRGAPVVRGGAPGARPERLPRLLAKSRGDGSRRSRRTAGFAPATSPSATRRASIGSRAASRTCTSRAARTSIRPRSRRFSTSTRASPTPPWSACPTSAGARSASRSSSPTASPTSELLEWCAARLARFKVPRSVRFIGEIPRNGMGKVQKQELRETEVAP